MYTIRGRVVVDRICLYEQIEDELDRITEIIGLPEKPELPLAKSSYRDKNVHYRDVYDEENRAFVEQQFQKEIELLGYEY